MVGSSKCSNLSIADDYFHDSEDLLKRYNLTEEFFKNTKSKRMKLFVDLRIAYECVLKSIFVYFYETDADRKEISKAVLKMSHDLLKLESEVKKKLSPALQVEIDHFSNDLKQLPIGLRYRLDVMDFLDAREDLYRLTIGDDDWLSRYYELIKSLTEFVDRKLSAESAVGPLSDFVSFEEAIKPVDNKYIKN